MARSAIWVVLVLAVAGVAVFMLTGGEEGVRDDGELALGDPDVIPEETGAPALKGAGSAPAATTATGKYTIKGTVLDAEGKPLAGIAVIAYESGPPWIPGDPNSWGWAEGQITRSLGLLANPERKRYPLRGRTESADDGSFTLRLASAAKYEVHARPAPPRIGTYNDISVYDKKPEQETTLSVLAGVPLRGRVVDADDKPVPCVVRASWWKSQTMGTQTRWLSGPIVAAAPDATFEIAAVPEGDVKLSVALKNERHISGFSVKSPHAGEFVIRIPTAADGLRGTVSDAAKQAIAGATVLISVTTKKEGDQPATTSEAKALTAADGTYTIAGLPPGDVSWVRAQAKGFLTLAEHKNQAPWSGAKVEKGKTHQLDLTLQRGGRVHGRVLVQSTNTPIAGARIRLLQSQQGGNRIGSATLTATTAADGTYEVKGVAAGRYVALPQHKDHFLPQLDQRGPSYVTPGQSQSSPAALTVVITGDDSDIERDLFMKPGSPLRGRVEDGSGRGVEGAEINARNYGISQVAWPWGLGGVSAESLATSEADGSFETAALPPRDDWVIYAKKKGLVGSFSEPVALAEGSPAPSVKLLMKKGAILRGRVVTEDATVLASAQVGLWGDSSELRSDASFKKIRPDGSFEITDVPPGDWTLNMWMNGRQGVQQPVKGLKHGEVREGIELTVAAGVRVAGILVDADGAGVPNTNVLLQGNGMHMNAQTDADGKFAFEGVKDGARVSIAVWGSSGGSRKLGGSFTAPKDDVRVVFEKEETIVISGEVQGPDGTPVPLCLVQVASSTRTARSNMYGQENGVETINGKFTQQVAGSGPYRVTVKSPRDEQGRALNLTAKTEKVVDPTKPVIIKLEGGLEVRGRVLDASGKPLQGIGVRSGTINVQTDASGDYVLAGLAKGKVSVQVTVKGSWIRPKEKRVAAGSRNVDFVLEKGVKICGNAYGPDGEPLTQGFASASWPPVGDYPNGSASSQMKPKGRFSIEGVPPGAVATVRVQTWNRTGGAAMAPKVIEGVRAGTDDLEVRLGGGVAIEGTLVHADGKPASQMYVNAQAADNSISSSYVQVASDGTWKLSGLEPKRYKINVWRQDGGAKPKPVEVDAPATGVRIVLPKTALLSGRVEGLGEDAAKWYVYVWTPDGTRVGRQKLQADGAFEVEIPEGESLTVGAIRQRDTRYGMKKDVRPGSTGIVMRLKEGHSISGSVDTAGSDERVFVQVQGKPWRGFATLDGDGNFEIKGLPPGRYALTARTQQGSMTAKTKANAGDTNVRLTLAPK